MKIINTSNKPFEFTWDGGHYGPILPGQIVDYPDEIAVHALRKSAVLFQDGQEIGNIDHYQMQPLNAVDQKTVREIAIYECPFKASGGCNEKPFKSMADLKAHLDTHWELMPEPHKQTQPAAPAARK